MIKVTPVVDDEFWILKDHEEKIGEVFAESDGTYSMKLRGTVHNIGDDINTLKQLDGVEFDDIETKVVPLHSQESVYGFPADAKAYNAIYDVKNRLAIYTKSAKSKSWFAAGYFMMKQNGDWETCFCPKLILLERYDYFGPVKDPEDFVFK